MWGGHSCPPPLILVLILVSVDCPTNAATSKQDQLQRRRTGVSAPHGVASRMNRSNTSFDSSLPRGVRRITSPSRSQQSRSDTLRNRLRDSVRSHASPNSAATSSRSTPRFRRNPRKKASSSAACTGTGVFLGAPPATYSSSESGEAKLHGFCRLRYADQHRVRVHAKPQIRLARPVLQIVSRLVSVAGEV